MFVGDRVLNLFRFLAVGLIAVVLIRTAWLSDDALITLRSALNISNGWGPGYNATEAVQAYIHPLWFVLWVWVGSWTNQWVLGVFAISLICVILAVGILAWRTQSLGRLILITGLLVLSNAFVDFTTSGLENPLAFLGLALLFALTTTSGKARVPDPWRFALVGLTSAAVLLTRFDLAALVLVPLVVFAWDQRKNLRGLLIAGGTLVVPLLVWLAWTWFTYSALLPNTFAAKTNAQIPRTEFIVQGLRYLWVSFENDPVTLIGLAAGIGVGIAIGPKMFRGWAFGALAYVGYVVWVGGDFMGGRFLAVPFFVALLILAASPVRMTEPQSDASHLAPVAAAAGTVALLLLGTNFAGIRVTALENPQEQRWEVDQNFNAGIVDARGSSVSNQRDLKSLVDNLSLAFLAPDFVPIGDGTGLNRPLRDLDKTTKNWPVNDGTFTQPSEVGVFCGFLGTIGIVTGPTTHLIDDCALTDRFLAERPFTPAEPFAWKPGHFHRGIPDGYVDAITTGDPTKMTDMADRFELEQLWEQIR